MADAAADTRTAILDAALAEVLAHGIRRTTASDIARRAEVSRQTLYRYWPDVQALLAALVTRELFAVVPRGGTAASLDDFADELVETADRIRSLPLLDRLRETDSELFSRYILERLGTSQRGIHREIAARVTAGQDDGFIRAGEPERFAAMLLLITQSAIQSAPLVEEWLPPDQWRRELHAAVVGYLEPRAVSR
jgi:AcrR family transcriptional regulator